MGKWGKYCWIIYEAEENNVKASEYYFSLLFAGSYLLVSPLCVVCESKGKTFANTDTPTQKKVIEFKKLKTSCKAAVLRDTKIALKGN